MKCDIKRLRKYVDVILKKLKIRITSRTTLQGSEPVIHFHNNYQLL